MSPRHEHAFSQSPHPFVILCVEAHPTNQLVLASQLESLGYTYEMAATSEDAFSKWQAQRHPLVLIDCYLSNATSIEFAERIREQEEQLSLAPTTLIATTNSSLTEYHQNCLASGFDHCIAKPFRVQALGTILRRFAEPILPDQQTPPHQSIVNEFALTGIDSHHLTHVIGSPNPQLLHQVLSNFEQSARDDLQAIQLGTQNVTPDQIALIAHAASGASASIGAFEISARFKQIAANCDDFAYVHAQIQSIVPLLRLLEEALNTVKHPH